MPETATLSQTTSPPRIPVDMLPSLAAILDGIGDGYFALDRDWRITFFNRAAERFFGKSRDEVLGTIFWESFPKILGSDMDPKFRQAMADRVTLDFEGPSPTFPDRWVEYHFIPIPEGLGLAFRDLTERHRAQEELQRKQRDLEDFFENGTVGLHWVSSDGTILRANQAELDLLGYTREEYIGRHIAEFHADEEVINDILARLTRGECLDKYPARLKAKDGSIKHVLISSNVQFRDGRFVNTRCFTLDVTEKREVEEKFRQLADNIPTLCWMADPDGWIFWYNKRWYDYTGTTPADMEGWGWQSVHDPEALPEVLERWKTSIASGQPFDMVFPLKGADGKFRPFLTRIEPFRDAEGRIVHWFGTNVDITEQRAAAKRQKLMINELNHRVKNTLTTIQSIAAQTFKGESVDRHALEMFNSRLVALSKAHDVLTRENWEGADIHAIVNGAVAPLRDSDRNCFGIDGPPLRLPSHMAVPLAMALHELGTNAAKYGALSTDTGQVEIAWTVEHGQDGRRFKLHWIERGGPPVTPPTRKGFGSRLIERGLAHDLGGTVELSYPPTGVTCTVDAPLPALNDMEPGKSARADGH